MAGNENQRFESAPMFDPSIQTQKIAFDAKDLVACDGCGRMNPPTRPTCIYCAKELDLEVGNAASIKHVPRNLEAWESGHNIIIREKSAAIDIVKISRLLSIETEHLTAILKAATPLPIARVESKKVASIIQSGLAGLGLKSSVVTDADLAAGKPPVRLGSIDLLDGALALKDFNTGTVTEIKANDLALIVPGMITMSRLDTIEKKGRRGRTKLIDQTATARDESILDIYCRHDPVGFRVHLAGFDFSCLGEDKGLLSVANLRRLTFVLREHAPTAKFIDDYNRVRQILGEVWQVESRKGLQRSGFGKVDFGVVASTTNLNQFTKYSRLQWHLL